MSQCRACGADLPVDARFCASCGQRVGSGPAGAGDVESDAAAESFASEFDARDSQRVAREMFQAHVDLLRRYRARVRELQRKAGVVEGGLAECEASPPSAENTQRTQQLLEEIETVGDGWDDVQRSYNADSETLDEEFMDRMSELELDVELPDHLQAKILEEHEGMSEELARLSESLRELGDRGGRIIGRATGRWTGAAAGGEGSWTRWWTVVSVLILGVAGVAVCAPAAMNWGWNAAIGISVAALIVAAVISRPRQ